MRKFIESCLVLFVFLSLGTAYVLAQQQVPRNPALWVLIQRELAGDPSDWQMRQVNPAQNNLLNLIPESPQDVVNDENNARTDNVNQSLNTNPSSQTARDGIAFMREFVDADSWTGSFYRLRVDLETKNDNFFIGDYKLKTDKTTELQKIRDIYLRITSTVTTFDVPPGGESASACLASGVGKCRHIATILQESFEDVGIKSEQVFSPTHTWVRVTLTEPGFEQITFDLDPTWYQQPIPLPPRSQSPIPQPWQDLMLAITQGPSGEFDLNGLWSLDSGGVSEVYHVGNTVSGKTVQSDKDFLVGRIGFYGSLDGTDFTGEEFLYALERKCASLDGYQVAFGTVAANTIVTNTTNRFYSTKDCAFTGESEPLTITYTRLPNPSSTPEED